MFLSTVVRGCCAECWIEVFHPNVVRNFLSLFNKKNVSVILKATSILCDTKYFAKSWKKIGNTVFLLLEQFGLG